MNTTEVLVTVTNKNSEVLEDLRPLVIEAFKNNAISILDFNIEENIGMSGKDVVLSFLISIAANIAYDGLNELVNSIVEVHNKACVVEIIELADEGAEIQSEEDIDDIKDDLQ